MGRPINYKKKFIKLLEQLTQDYPEVGLGRHLDTALSDYGPLWTVSEKELCYAIEKYVSELEMDVQHIVPDEYVNEIIEDAKHLFDNTSEEDEEDGY